MKKIAIVYDKKSNKIGVAIPYKRGNDEDGIVVKFFYDDVDMPNNNWQSLDTDFVILFEGVPITEPFYLQAKKEVDKWEMS